MRTSSSFKLYGVTSLRRAAIRGLIEVLGPLSEMDTKDTSIRTLTLLYEARLLKG